jgi:small-conductance mechanosensitive channel
LLLLLQQPFSIDEFIEVAGYSGRVTAVSMRATALTMDDGKIVLIPNATVFTSPIVKRSQQVAEKHVELKQPPP